MQGEVYELHDLGEVLLGLGRDLAVSDQPVQRHRGRGGLEPGPADQGGDVLANQKSPG